VITAEQVLAAARAGESETQEFKRSTGELRSAMHALTAMLNHRGGRVFFGVEPDQRVVGQQVSDRTLEELAQEIGQIEPPVFPAVERVVVAEGCEVLVVTVPQGPGRPYSHRGVAYRRVGNVNARMSRDEYNRLLLETLHAERRWENEPAEGWAVADLDADEIVRTVDEAVRRGRVEDPGTRDPGELLRGLGLAREGTLLRAALVLFGRDDALELRAPQCLLRVARFRSEERRVGKECRRLCRSRWSPYH
jgi:ATP-dependent DNA helicase RecG